MLRELQEEIGVAPEHVLVVHESPCWRRYDFVHQKMRSDVGPGFCGQQQKWFLCEISDLSHCDLTRAEGEFEEVSLFAAADLLQLYAVWKRSPFLDFCREIGLFQSAVGAPFHGDPK
jgi:8-oxo-dGTP pyrophosphatase MutT (NUDIX family)